MKEIVDLQQKYDELSTKYEDKCLTLLVAHADSYDCKMSERSKTNGLLREINTLQHQHRMGNDKIKGILHRHKDKTRTLINDLLKESWNAWSQQDTKLE